jgi:hypothetical protein
MPPTRVRRASSATWSPVTMSCTDRPDRLTSSRIGIDAPAYASSSV